MNYSAAEFEAAFGTYAQMSASDKPEICFAGRSNVGKSSLINRVLGRKNLARVSTKPGKTVTINFYKLGNIRLVDLPGYGYAKVSDSERMRLSDLMESYFKSGRDIKMTFQLIDMRHKPSDFDLNMIDFLRQTGTPFTVVLTKSDKLNKSEYKAACEQMREILGNDDFIPFSAQNGEGVEAVRKVIETAVEANV